MVAHLPVQEVIAALDHGLLPGGDELVDLFHGAGLGHSRRNAELHPKHSNQDVAL